MRVDDPGGACVLGLFLDGSRGARGAAACKHESSEATMSGLTKAVREYVHRSALAASLLSAVAAPGAAEAQATGQAFHQPLTAATSGSSATMFEYEAGARYAITTAIQHVTDLALQPGERVLSTA